MTPPAQSSASFPSLFPLPRPPLFLSVSSIVCCSVISSRSYRTSRFTLLVFTFTLHHPTILILLLLCILHAHTILQFHSTHCLAFAVSILLNSSDNWSPRFTPFVFGYCSDTHLSLCTFSHVSCSACIGHLSLYTHRHSRDTHHSFYRHSSLIVSFTYQVATTLIVLPSYVSQFYLLRV